MSMALKRIKIYNAILLTILFLLVHLSFVLVISGFWEYLKTETICEVNYWRLFVSIVVVLLFILVLTILKLKDFLYSILSLILIFFVFPSAILFASVKGIDYRIFLSHSLFYIMTILIANVNLSIISKKISPLNSKRILFLTVLIGMIPYLILYIPYINLNNLLLIDVYETRESMGLAVNNFYTNYTYSWFNKFIIPSLLIFGIYFRDRITIILCTASLIFLYLCGAHKAVFVGLFFTFILYKYPYLTKINYLLKVLLLIAVGSLVISIAFKNDFLMLMSVRRTMILPAFLDILYFDLFDNNHLYWSETFNGIFKDYPYEVPHAFVVGEKYFGYPEWGANNGIISEGFMNWGMAGVFINIIFVAFYFNIMSQLNISGKFFGLFFLFIFLIISGSLTTVLLTHGGIILLLISFLFLKNTDEQMD